MQLPHKALIDHRIYPIRLRKIPEFPDLFNRLAMPILLELDEVDRVAMVIEKGAPGLSLDCPAKELA
ncbi:hypothetical protein D9M68_954880 [compost metagenome]